MIGAAVVWKAAAVALGTVVPLLFPPGAALAPGCGEASYQEGGGVEPGCGGALPLAAAAVVGGAVLAVTVALAVASHAAGGIPKPELDALIDSQTTPGEVATPTPAPQPAPQAVAQALEQFGLASDPEATRRGRRPVPAP